MFYRRPPSCALIAALSALGLALACHHQHRQLTPRRQGGLCGRSGADSVRRCNRWKIGRSDCQLLCIRLCWTANDRAAGARSISWKLYLRRIPARMMNQHMVISRAVLSGVGA